MAAIFQIRRGTTNVSLTEGELYLHQGSGSLQFGSGSTNYNVLTLNAPVKGDVILTGNITASNAYFSGDVAISGNLFLGNNTGDNISVPGVFTTNLVPGTNGTLDLGTSGAKWKTLYANSVSASFSGSIDGIDVTILSQSIDSQFDAISTISASLISTASANTISVTNLNTFSSSQLTQNASLLSYTGSVETRLTEIGVVSGSLIASASAVSQSVWHLHQFSSSQLNKDTDLQTYTSSLETRMSAISTETASLETRMVEIGVVSASLITSASSHRTSITELNSWSASAKVELYNLESKSASVDISVAQLNSYTSSLKTAIELTGSNVVVLGDLTVKGTTTQVDSTTIQLGDNIIELNGSAAANGGLLVKDATNPNTISGSLLWDSTNDYWKAGALGAESKVLLAGGDNVFTSSAQLTELNQWTSSAKIALSNIETATSSLQIATASLQSWSASAIVQLNNLESTTASLNISVSNINTFSASQLNKDNTLEVYTASIEDRMVALRNETASIEERFSVIAPLTASYNARWNSLEVTTASLVNDTNNLELFSSSQLTQNFTLAGYTASIDTRLTQLGVISGSLITTASNHEQRIGQLESKSSSVDVSITNLNSYTQSVDTQLTSIYQTTASINLYTASALVSMSAIFATASNHETRLDYIEGVAFGGIDLNAQFGAIGTLTGSLILSASAVSNSVWHLHQFSSSQLTQNSTLATYTGSVETRLIEVGVVSGSLINSASNASMRLNSLESFTGSFATTGSNTFNGTQTISGSLYITQDLIVQGSSSLQTISASAVDIGTNIIYLNTDTPAIRFAGLSVFDSGSTGGTGSLFWDSENERWIYQKSSGSQYSGGMLISGPRNNGALGDEVGMPTNKLIMGIGGDHISSSGIYHNGTDVAIPGILEVTGSIIGNIIATNGLVSGSSQVLDILTSVNLFTSSIDTTIKTKLNSDGVISGSSQLGTLNSFTASVETRLSTIGSVTSSYDTRWSTLATMTGSLINDTNNLETFSASALTRLDSLEGTDISITLTGDVTGTGTITNLGNVSFATTIAANSVALGSDTTGNYVASLVEGTGVTITNNSGETATPTIAIGQAVATTSNVQFGSIGVGTTASGVSGEIRATGDIVAYYSSDERLKENITPIENAVEKINQMGGYNYNWKEGFETIHSHKGHDLGVIAQEVQSVLPEVVSERETGYLAVDYVKLVPVLIEAIKELSAKIDRLENK